MPFSIDELLFLTKLLKVSGHLDLVSLHKVRLHTSRTSSTAEFLLDEILRHEACCYAAVSSELGYVGEMAQHLKGT